MEPNFITKNELFASLSHIWLQELEIKYIKASLTDIISEAVPASLVAD